MFGLKDIELLFVGMAVSAVLFFVLAYYKRYAYYWWAIGGIIACLPIALLVNALQKHILKTHNLSNSTVFILCYLLIYVALWLLTKRNEVSEEERAKQEKLDVIIFDGFLALKENRVEDAYHIFRNASVSYPENQVIQTMVSSFEKGSHGIIRKSRFLDFQYKLKLLIKGKKYPAQINQIRDNPENSPEDRAKPVKGRLLE